MSRLVYRYESYKVFARHFIGDQLYKKLFEILDVGGEYKVRLCVLVGKYNRKTDNYSYSNFRDVVVPINTVTQNSICFAEYLGVTLDDELLDHYKTSDIELEHIVSAIEKDCETYVD